MAKKFTFKTHKPTGRYRSFSNPTHNIKLEKIEVGTIEAKPPFRIRLQVIKATATASGSGSCWPSSRPLWKRRKLS